MLATTLRPRPAEPVDGRTVAFFSTAPESAHEMLAAHLRDEHGADVVHVSGNLADRRTLREELEQRRGRRLPLELKAAAIDVVAETALERGVDVVLAGSDVLSVDEPGPRRGVAAPGGGGRVTSERRKGERRFRSAGRRLPTRRG